MFCNAIGDTELIGQVKKITLATDQGDSWLCETEDGESAMIYATYASDYPDDTEFMASMIKNRDPYPVWFVNGIYPLDMVLQRGLNGIVDGNDNYLNLFTKARLCRKIVEIGNRENVWYVPNAMDVYVEEYEK